MKKPSIKKNYIYNLLFQLFALITPLITTPYIARVLSADGSGQYSFSATIISFFSMFAALGFGIYAQREIAKRENNIFGQSIIFWEVLICKLTIGFFVFCICWILVLTGVFNQYTFLIELLSIEIIGMALNITFFFQGNEKFGLIAIRDFIIRIVGIILIFTLVKRQSDIWIYALCNAGTTLASSVSLYFCLRKSIVVIGFKELKPFRHFFPSLKMFVPTIAISVFTLLDKALIGVMVKGTIETQLADGTMSIARIADIENGYYLHSEKIIKMAMMVIASLGTVMMPRNSRELAQGHEDVFILNVKKAISFTFLIGCPIFAGLSAISFLFSPWFFGGGYDKVPVLIIIFSFMVLPSGLGNVLGQQYLIPRGEDNKYVVVYVLCAILNLTLNLLFIPLFLSYGAAAASVLAEVFATCLMLILVRKKINLKSLLSENWKPIISSLIMFGAVFSISFALQPSIIDTFVLIIEGALLYGLLLLILRYKFLEDLICSAKRAFLRRTHARQ